MARTIYGFSAPWPTLAGPRMGPAEAPRVGDPLRPVADAAVGVAHGAPAGVGAGDWGDLDSALRRQLSAVGAAMLTSSALIVAGLVRWWGINAGLWPFWPLF